MPSVRPRRSSRTRPYRRSHTLRPSKLHRSLTDYERERRLASSSSGGGVVNTPENEQKPTIKIIEKRNEVSAVNVPKIPRESIRSATFIFSELDWSKWELISTTRAAVSTRRDWEERRSGVGRQKATLYGGDTTRPAIYEFAVRSCDVTGAEMTAVYFRTTMGFANKQEGSLDYLLGADHVVRQIDAVLPKCDILMRRACFDDALEYRGQTLWNPTDCKRVLLREYDYAWVPTASRRAHRQVAGNGCQVSQVTM